MDYIAEPGISRSLTTESESIDACSCNAIEADPHLSSSKLTASKIANKIAEDSFALTHQRLSSHELGFEYRSGDSTTTNHVNWKPPDISELLVKKVTDLNNFPDNKSNCLTPFSESKVACNPQPLTATSGEHNESLFDYYRIIYPGVVGLLSAPDEAAPRSGKYLSYGEVFASKKNNELKEDEGQILPNEKALRVDLVLTGGYATDASSCFCDTDIDAETPKRSNIVDYSIKRTPYTDSRDGDKDSSLERFYGYIFPEKKNVVIVERLQTKPIVDVGTFLYKIVSSNPIPVLTGPCPDAPKTRALLLPDSVIEVSLRVCFHTATRKPSFLRLNHRRGWIADHIILSTVGKASVGKLALVAVELSSDGVITRDDQSLPGFSSSVSFPLSTHRRRHKPPRRLVTGTSAETSSEKFLPHQVAGKLQTLRNKIAVPNLLQSDRLATPCSNISILSDDSSFDNTFNNRQALPTSPDTSFSTANSATSSRSKSVTQSHFFLMRVTAPEGLRILDAPHFQVNNLIRGKQNGNFYSMQSVGVNGCSVSPIKTNSSIFQTMSSRIAPSATSITSNTLMHDSASKIRVLPLGSLFEASRRMEKTGAFKLGIGLIKLSDNSGWAIVPHPYTDHNGVVERDEKESVHSFEEVGSAVLSSWTSQLTERNETVEQHWVRIVTRGGVRVYCAVSNGCTSDEETSPSSSKGSSSISGSIVGSTLPPETSSDSDIASSVGSAFLDALFRTPKKRGNDTNLDRQAMAKQETTASSLHPEIACGCFVAVEPRKKLASGRSYGHEFVRMKGGQGWIPVLFSGKVTAVNTPAPDIKYGSYWYRVQSLHGIKVRSGPSRKAQSIKSDHGVHFRFECGEFLRVSEVVTAFSNDGIAIECFAKLYRNRHIQLQQQGTDSVQLAYLTSQSEWVEVFRENEQFLGECAFEPRIERHRQGWRYNVVPDSGIEVRKGPSFSSEKTGIILFGGESILINERVFSHDEGITWLRMLDGQGWVYDCDAKGNNTMIPHSLRYRTKFSGTPQKADVGMDGKEVAYDAIIARLFHSADRLDRDQQVPLNREIP